MNPEHPAHGEVKVEQRHREAAADYWQKWSDEELSKWMTDEALAGDHDDDPDSLVFAFARFEQSLTTPPATDVALREPDYIHEQHGPECACPKCWPDQPQIGDLERVINAITPEILRKEDGRDTYAFAEAVARAAIAAMPKEDIWEEAARFAHEIADGMRFVGDTDEGRIRHEGLVAGARFVAAALRFRRAKC